MNMNRGNAIGIIELSSISKGYEVEDAVLKSTNIEKLVSRTVCSGKFLILVRGEIGDVEACLSEARETGGYSVIEALIIPHVDNRIFPAIAGTVPYDSGRVDGMLVLETFSVASAIKIADIAVKEADVTLLRIHAAMAIGGKGLVLLAGNIEALKSALAPVLVFMKEEGMLAGHALITHPHPDVLRDLY